MPPRLAYGWSGAASATVAPSATGAPAFETTWPSIVTCPARISARARSRVAARPRSTSATSRRFFDGKPLILARQHPVGDGGEMAGVQSGVRERPAGALDAIGGERARLLEAEQSGVGRLGAGGVLAGGLPELRGAAFDVEDVVDDLKAETEIGGVPVHRLDERGVGAGHHGAAGSGGADERAGFLCVHGA